MQTITDRASGIWGKEAQGPAGESTPFITAESRSPWRNAEVGKELACILVIGGLRLNSSGVVITSGLKGRHNRAQGK